MFTYSVERALETRKFHVAVVHRRLRNVQIKKACAREKLLVTWRHTSLYFTYYVKSSYCNIDYKVSQNAPWSLLFHKNSLECSEILQWQQYCSHHAYALNRAGIRYLHTSCFCISNRTSELRSLVRFLIQKRVGKYRTKHFTCGIVFIVYILRQKKNFSPRMCAKWRSASCKKRWEFWRATHTPLWLLIGCIIFSHVKNLVRDSDWTYHFFHVWKP